MYLRVLFCLLTFLTVARPVFGVTIETVPVGYVGNAPDQVYHLELPSGFNPEVAFGSVSHDYRIGKYEVTNAQYVEFLNAKAKSDPFELYNPEMGTDPLGGIVRNGSSGNFSYAQKPTFDNRPVNFVSWYDAVRFTNWLHNGQGLGDTETGAYSLLGFLANPLYNSEIVREPNAKWFLPTDDEWYKAAYYDPRLASEGGPAGDDHYWLFATRSDAIPTRAIVDAAGGIANPGSNVSNYGALPQDSRISNVGAAGPSSDSFFGTSDQSGNICEWNESARLFTQRGVLGGPFTAPYYALGAYFPGYAVPTDEYATAGFRVAMVPEPSGSLLSFVALAATAALAIRRRFFAGTLIPSQSHFEQLRAT